MPKKVAGMKSQPPRISLPLWMAVAEVDGSETSAGRPHIQLKKVT